MKKTITAECHSDDYLYQVEFDAKPWFEKATPEEIANLIECNWRGDYPADDVALYMKQFVPKLQVLLEYVTAVGMYRDMGFEVSVNEDEALIWLKKNRPEIVKE